MTTGCSDQGASCHNPVPQIEKEAPERLDEALIGCCASFAQVLNLVRIVAPTDSPTLILGETGTGKGSIARAIHNQSLRQRHSFVTLNCAAIPASLLEGELFGHERGAYTGALSQTIGRLELADKGTLFLDEIGDLPLELQPKLLRTLQEQEFERLGSTRTIRVDVRVIAATNHDLSELVQQRRFRADLYYRLNVIPITVPALRERSEDIPLLTDYFLRHFSKRMNKSVEKIPQELSHLLSTCDWPGNIRELQNFIERTVIMSTGRVLRPAMADLKYLIKHSPSASIAFFMEAERDHILEALRETNWVVGGRRGAAAVLGMARSTLIDKMRKLGVDFQARPRRVIAMTVN
jgi:transcriptional regulator with GAF, ATPase, and Fis domain